jgi:hypothetical protein
MDSKLIGTIRQIAPTGPEGFEGLVAQLLTAFTGRRFHLARSGSQAGRDMSTRHASSNVVAVECKRYGRETELDERELLGELAQAIRDIPDLDLWVLVSSRDVPSQLYEALYQQARHDSIEFLSISVDDGEPSSLEALCAQSPEVVIAHVESEISSGQREELEQLLAEVAAHPKFLARIEHVKDQFLSSFIGYDNWRSVQNQWFQDCLASEAESRAHFGQLLNIREPGAVLVQRRSAWTRLDEWFSGWNETRKILFLLGEEGDGKTWAVASWLDRNIQDQKDFPAVVFLSSLRVDSNEPLSLLSGGISRRLPTLQTEDWARRLYRWTNRSKGNVPSLLLVLDGINERRKATWWRELIDQLAGSPWCDSAAILITCRTAYWQRHFEKLRYLQTVTYTLPPYDDKELDTALAYHSLSRPDVSDDLMPLIRKPRYFDLMIEYRAHIAKSGDVTVARLIYEDWRDRLQRKEHLELDDDAFQDLIRELASGYLEGQGYVKERDFDDLLPSYWDKQAIVEELRTGGILQAKGGHYQVDEHLLIHGFGLLLVDQLEKEPIASERDLGEVIAEWLEPQAEMDVKASICEFAALHALSLPKLPRRAKVALLNAWISSHNSGEETAANFTAYYPIDPSCYTELAEVVWSDVSDNPWAQALLMHTLLRWHDFPQVTAQLCSAFERWLGFVHLYGVSYQRWKTEEDAERLRQEICDRVDSDLQPGPFTFAARPLTVTEDDGLLRLGRAALAVISHISRGPFVRAIATGCVAEAIMGTPAKYDLFKWVMSTARQSVWDEVGQEVKHLLGTDHLVTKQAAYRLLSFEGSEKAHELQQTISANLFPPHPLLELHKKDSCTSGFAWSQEECEACFQREDLLPQHIARQSKHHCVNPDLPIPDDLGTRLEPLVEHINIDSVWSLMGPTGDDIALDEYESSLCAYAPYAMAGLVRRIVRQADLREGLSLRQLAWRLTEHYLIFEEEETSSIYRAWSKLHEEISTWSKTQQEVEMFLFRLVLKGLDVREQFEHLLERPDEAPDLTTYEPSFLPMTDWEVVWNELSSLQNIKRRQRTLWFLSAHPDAIPRCCISEKLAPFLNHENSLVRSSILKILYFTKYEEVINAFIEDGWAWNKSFCDRENHWGSLLLCEHGDSLTYSELRSRVHPTYLGYAVRCRGVKDNELDQYAEDVHHLWSRIGTETPDLPVDFPLIDVEAGEDVAERTCLRLSSTTLSKSITFMSRNLTWGGVSSADNPADVFQSWESKDEEYQNLMQIAQQAIEEQMEAGNLWFAQHFYADALEQILERRPDLASKWVEFALADTDDAIRRIRLAGSFYDALCTTLLKREPSTGSRLYWQVLDASRGVTVRDARSKIRVLDYALFKALATDDIQDTWERRLEQCTTDQELMQVAIVAQHGNGRDWLQSYIKQRIHSSAPLEKSRAFTLLGFIEAKENFELLSELLETEPDTWIKDLLRTSLRRWLTNAWAKHWFRRFLAIDDNVAAWAAFRLLLQCVDGRFWLWQQAIQSEVENSAQLEKRIAFLKDNSGTIENRIQKNEEPLKKHLFGQKINPAQVWPWM